MTHWFNVKDALPTIIDGLDRNRSYDVIICFKFKYAREWQAGIGNLYEDYDMDTGKISYHWETLNGTRVNVSHWKPFPDLPKED